MIDTPTIEALENLCGKAPWEVDVPHLLYRVKKIQMEPDTIPGLLSREYAEILLAVRFYGRRADFQKLLEERREMKEEIELRGNDIHTEFMRGDLLKETLLKRNKEVEQLRELLSCVLEYNSKAYKSHTDYVAWKPIKKNILEALEKKP